MRGIRSVLAAAVLASVLVIAGCSSAPSTPAGSTGTGSGTTGAAPSSAAVVMSNMAFSPSDVTVAVGGTVTWTNNDSVAHTATGDSFDSGSLAPGKSFSQTFTAAGTFPFHCSIHSGMTGTVTVK